MAADGQPVKVGSQVLYIMDAGTNAGTERPAVVTDLNASDESGLSRVNLAVFPDVTDFDTPQVLFYQGVVYGTTVQMARWIWPS
jgi:hypothetical protein